MKQQTEACKTALLNIKNRALEFYSKEQGNANVSGRYFKNSWIYQDKCAVIDFTYNGVNFAFNLFSVGDEDVRVDVLQRKGPSDFLLHETLKTQMQLVQSAKLNQALLLIDQKCVQIIKNIDSANTATNQTKNESHNRKRVGVVTLPLNKNYGGNLQAYALMQTITLLGHEAVFVNRRFPVPGKPNQPQNNLPLYSGTVGLSPKLANRKFVDSNFAKITRTFFSSEELSSNIENYHLDAVIVGSDQVWRPKYAHSLLADFFLGFIPAQSSIKKISYAASFGADSWEYSAEEAVKTSQLIRSFDALSVREDDAVGRCREHFDVTPQHVLDPTMLLPAEHYSGKFELNSLRGDEPYLLNYVLDANEDKEAAIKHLSEEVSVAAHSVNGLPYSSVNALSASEGDQSVEGWLAAFYKAKYIITDSFHGVAFSILFNKPFIAYGNPARGLARFTSLLKMFGLSERLVTNSTQVSQTLMQQRIDWQAVNTRLNELRISSLDFLLKAIGDMHAITAALGKLGHQTEGETWSVNLGASLGKVTGQMAKLGKVSSTDSVELEIRRFPQREASDRFTITDVLKQDMCIGCGACSIVTNNKVKVSVNNLGFEVADAQQVKKLSSEDLSRADTVCPFSDNSLNEDELDAPHPQAKLMPHDASVGRYSALFAGRRTSNDTVVGSSSGGLTSWLVNTLLLGKKIDAVIHVGRSNGCDALFEYRISTSVHEVEQNRKSNYYPTTLANVLSELKARGLERVAIVGVPCFIKAARLVEQQDHDIAKRLSYFIGLVCGHMKSRAFAEANAWQLGVHPDNIKSVDFRKKVPGKKVGQYHFAVVENINENERSGQPTSLVGGNWGHACFQPNACNYCDDIYAETADVVFGDAWLPKYNDEWRGTNIVVIRNPELEVLFESGQQSQQITVEELSLEEVIQTQFGGLSHRRQGLALRVKDDREGDIPYPAKRVDPDKVNPPFWRVELMRQRKKMSRVSSEAFYEAKQRNCLEFFEIKMAGEIAVYKYIESLKNRKFRQ